MYAVYAVLGGGAFWQSECLAGRWRGAEGNAWACVCSRGRGRCALVRRTAVLRAGCMCVLAVPGRVALLGL